MKIKNEHQHLSNQAIIEIYGPEAINTRRKVLRTVPQDFFPKITMEGVKYLQIVADQQEALISCGQKPKRVSTPKEFILPSYKIKDIKAAQNATND